jgi:hypothetical protein
MKPESLETKLLNRIDRTRGDVFLRADFSDLGVMTRWVAFCVSLNRPPTRSTQAPAWLRRIGNYDHS